MTMEDGIVKQTSWWVYELFCRFMKGYRVQFAVDSEMYEGSTKPEWLKDSFDTRMRYLDVSACVDGEGWCCVAVANLHKSEDLRTSFAGVKEGTGVEAYTVSGQNLDDTNMDGEEMVSLKESRWKTEDTFVFPKHSFVLLRWKV